MSRTLLAILVLLSSCPAFAQVCGHIHETETLSDSQFSLKNCSGAEGSLEVSIPAGFVYRLYENPQVASDSCQTTETQKGDETVVTVTVDLAKAADQGSCNLFILDPSNPRNSAIIRI